MGKRTVRVEVLRHVAHQVDVQAEEGEDRWSERVRGAACDAALRGLGSMETTDVEAVDSWFVVTDSTPVVVESSDGGPDEETVGDFAAQLDAEQRGEMERRLMDEGRWLGEDPTHGTWCEVRLAG